MRFNKLLFLCLVSVAFLLPKVRQTVVLDAPVGAGFFASFLMALSYVVWHDKTKNPLFINWGSKNLYYQPEGYHGSKNVWEYYFDPICKNDGTKIENCSFESTDRAPDRFKVMGFYDNDSRDYEYRKWIKTFIDKYIKIKPHIQQKIDSFYKEKMVGKFNVGIHLRRTDHALEVNTSIVADYISEANKYDGAQFFVATDDTNALEECKQHLKGKVFYYDCFRSRNGQPIHQPVDIEKPKRSRKAQYGEDVLIDAQLLAKCDIFIHGLSNVSTAALFFNPEMKDIQLGSVSPIKIGPDFQLLQKILPSNPVIIEVGARFGIQTGWLSHYWPLGTIYALEPCNRAYKTLLKEVGKRSNVKVYNYSVSIQEGERLFYDMGWVSSLLNPSCYLKDFIKTLSIQIRNVKCVNLDQWAERNNIGKVDLLLLGVNGTSLDVLRSSKNILKQVKVVEITGYGKRFWESCSGYPELKHFLNEHDFYESKRIFLNSLVGRYVFVKRDLI